MTDEIAALLENTTYENLSLINQSRIAQAYCGIGQTQKSMNLAEKILPQLQNDFGTADIETLAFMFTVAENHLRIQHNHDALKFLIKKFQVARDKYGTDNLIILSKIIMELASYYFEIGDINRGEEFLNSVLVFVTQSVDKENNHDAFQMYKALNETATKYLDSKNIIVLKSELGLAQMNNIVGNIQHSIKLCKKNLPEFKKVFGEQGNETLVLMKILSDDYLLLGKYADAKKIVEERLSICKNNFGEHNVNTIASTIDLANICYRMGKYNTADKLLNEVNVPQNKDIFKDNPEIIYYQWFNEYFGERMKGGNILNYVDSYKACIELNLAENYVEAKRYSDAVKLCDDTLVLQKVPVYSDEQISIYSGVVDLFRIKATAQKLLGYNANAYENYKKLIQIYEGKRIVSVKTSSSPESKSKWFTGIIPVYRNAAFVAASDKVDDTTFAFYCTEFCKGRNLIDRFDDILATKDYLLNVNEKKF